MKLVTKIQDAPGFLLVVNLLIFRIYNYHKEKSLNLKIEKSVRRNFMKAIICREFKNYMKNPLYWIGIVIVVISIYSNLSEYLDIHMFSNNQEVEQLKDVKPTDADVMNGYIPATFEEQMDIGLKDIKQTFIDAYDMTELEAENAIEDVKAQKLSVAGTIKYLEDKYQFYDGKAVFMEAEQKKATAAELNNYIELKLSEHSYAYYFAKKYADFTGFHIAFFAVVLLAFLFIRDMKKDIYELLHTKAISARSYVLGKYFGGIFPLSLAVLIITVVFTVLCQNNNLQTNIIDSFVNMLLATVLFVMPTVLICVGIYVLIALLFKNPLPSIPLILTYIVYSNMGSYDVNGNYGFYGQILGMLFRFEGEFFETEVLPVFQLNQIALLLLTLLFISVGVWRWRTRRI